MRISDWSSDVCSSDLLSTLQSAVNGLRSPPGLTGVLSNVFEQKSAFVSSNSSTAATEILGATATNNAQAGKYEIIVEQLAQAHKVSGTALADISTDLGLTETLPIRSEEHTSELQSLMRLSYALFSLKNTKKFRTYTNHTII